MSAPRAAAARGEAAAGAAPELVMLGELSARLGELTDVERVALELARSVKWLLPAPHCSLLLVDAARGSWRVLPGTANGSLATLTGPLALTLQRGTQLVDDGPAESDSAHPAEVAAFAPSSRSRLMLALSGPHGILGTLNLSTPQVDAYARAAWALPALLQAHVAAAVQRCDDHVRISELNRTLEARVEERTAQLQSTLVELQAEASQRLAAQAALRHQADHDPLTDLGNRRLLSQRLGSLLTNRRGGEVALVLLDLDDFKTINDSLGHAVGDTVLVRIAQRLRAELHPDDLAVRLGGDEFAVLLGSDGPARAPALVQRLLQVMTAPLALTSGEVRISTSIGVAYAADATSTDTLLRDADLALYAAKNAGKNGAAVFEPGMHSAATERLELAAALNQSIRLGNGLSLHHQPLVRADSGTVVSTEALARWTPEGRKPIPPDYFIPLAEQTGLIRPLTRWALSTALDECAALVHAGWPLTVAVNLSVCDLYDPELPHFITQELQTRRMPAERLHVEVTEGTLISDPDLALATLQRLRDLGLHMSIDDFGTGYSSLAYLKRLPVDRLKIDRAFVRQLTVDSRDQAIVRSTILLAHELDLEVVAEGVEDEPTWALLRELGCDLIQGFLVSRPVPVGRLVGWLGDWHPRPSDLAA